MVRGDVEGGVVHADAVGGGLPAEAVGDLARVALFDRDPIAGGQAEVEGAGGGGDVEGDAVGAGQQGDAVGADLVGGVAVGGDAVGADEDAVHPPFLHHLGGHAVADEGDGDAALPQLPGGQPGALEQGPRLVRVHLEAPPLFGGGEQHRQRR